MVPTQAAEAGDGGRIGPYPSIIQVAKSYIFEQKLQECRATTGVSETKEDNIRIQGVAWIDNVRKSLRLYERDYCATSNTC
jgi:CTD kinase subunit beta